MLKVLSRVDKLYWLLVPIILYQTWPWLAYRIRPIVPFCLFCLWILLYRRPFVMSPHGRRLGLVFVGVCVSWFLVTFINTFYFVFGHGDLTKYYVLSSALGSFTIFIIYYLSFRMGRFNEIVFLTFIALIGVCLSAIASFKASNIVGFESARILTTDLNKFGTYENVLGAIDARVIGAAGYGTSYAYALFLPAIVWAFFKSRTFVCRVLFGIATISILFSIKVGGLGTVVFVAAFGLILLFFSRVRLKSRHVYILGFIGIAGLLLFAYKATAFSWMSGAIQFIGQFFPEEGSIAQRIRAVCDAINGDMSSYAVERYQLQVRSLDTFFKHPLVGVGLYYFPHEIYYQIGGHSQLLDLMAQAGIPGFVMYFLFIYALNSFYCSLEEYLRLDNGWRILISIYLSSYIFLSVANPIIALPSPLYMIPGIALMLRMMGATHAK